MKETSLQTTNQPRNNSNSIHAAVRHLEQQLSSLERQIQLASVKSELLSNLLKSPELKKELTPLSQLMALKTMPLKIENINLDIITASLLNTDMIAGLRLLMLVQKNNPVARNFIQSIERHSQGTKFLQIDISTTTDESTLQTVTIPQIELLGKIARAILLDSSIKEHLETKKD
jgi:hypothetical protein